MKSVRIGAAQAFYGDKLKPAIDMARNAKVDYLCFDCLAELTLAILQKDRQKNPALGYTRDVIPVMKALLPICLPQGIRLITNAGGIHPEFDRLIHLDHARVRLVPTGKPVRAEATEPLVLFDKVNTSSDWLINADGHATATNGDNQQ